METESFIFCENIKRLRQKEGLTKEKMSRILEITIEELELIEKGILPSSISVDILFIVFDNYKISPGKMLTKIINSNYN